MVEIIELDSTVFLVLIMLSMIKFLANLMKM